MPGKQSAGIQLAPIQKMSDTLPTTGSTVIFRQGSTYNITGVDYPTTRVTTFAYGAKFVLTADATAFDLNPDSDPTAVEANSKSFG